jgi:hypothetical protein
VTLYLGSRFEIAQGVSFPSPDICITTTTTTAAAAAAAAAVAVAATTTRTTLKLMAWGGVNIIAFPHDVTSHILFI